MTYIEQGGKRMKECVAGMVIIISLSAVSVALAAPIPTADDLADATAQRILAWGVIIMASAVAALAGLLVQSYLSRIKAVEAQVNRCRECQDRMRKSTDEFAEAVRDLRKHFHERVDDRAYLGMDKRHEGAGQ